MKHIQYNYQTVQYCLILGILASILSFYLVAADSSHMIPNTVFHTITVTAFPMILWIFKINDELVKGVALAHSAFLLIFSIWLCLLNNPDSTIWIYYVFSLLGGIAGGIISVQYTATNQTNSNQIIAFGLTILGMFLVFIGIVIPMF